MAQQDFEGIPPDLTVGGAISSAALNLYTSFLRFMVKDGTEGDLGETSPLTFNATSGAWELELAGEIHDWTGVPLATGAGRGWGRTELVFYTGAGSSSTFDPNTDAPWAHYADVLVVGAGGGGGGSYTTVSGEASVGGGGASGDWARQFFDLSGGFASRTINVGAVGVGAAGAAGTQGGTTSCGTLSAAGGKGGGAAPATVATRIVRGGVPGNARVGDVTGQGMPGHHGFILGAVPTQVQGGNGASSILGGGGVGATGFGEFAGANGNGFGAGGGGAAVPESTNGQKGGDGGGGACIVTLLG